MSHGPEWVPFTRAADAIAERFIDAIADDWWLAYKSAWHILLGALASGETTSRSANGSFECRVEEGSEPLPPAPSADPETGFIPPVFWDHYFAEIRLAETSRELVLAEHKAWNRGNDFTLSDHEVRGDGRLSGSVKFVEVRAASLPTGRLGQSALGELSKSTRRGRPSGSGYNDESVMKQVVAAVEFSRIDWDHAIRTFAPKLEGGGSIKAKRQRLRGRLRALGYLPQTGRALRQK